MYLGVKLLIQKDFLNRGNPFVFKIVLMSSFCTNASDAKMLTYFRVCCAFVA